MPQLLDLITFFVSAVIVLPFGRIIGRKINEITSELEPSSPEGVDEDDWKRVVWTGKQEQYKGGRWVGRLECLVFVAALSFSGPIIIGAWLAFKVATKWEVWRNVVRVPEVLELSTEISWLQARTSWGTWLLNRFLIGTLANLLASFLAFAVASRIIVPVGDWVIRNWDYVLFLICPAAAP